MSDLGKINNEQQQGPEVPQALDNTLHGSEGRLQIIDAEDSDISEAMETPIGEIIQEELNSDELALAEDIQSWPGKNSSDDPESQASREARIKSALKDYKMPKTKALRYKIVNQILKTFTTKYHGTESGSIDDWFVSSCTLIF